MKILFLHLSDLHLSKDKDVDELATKEIAASLAPQSIGAVNKVIVLITGDIAYSGKKSEYDSFYRFKRLLISALKEKVLGRTFIHVYIVPGNHDIDYSHISAFDDIVSGNRHRIIKGLFEYIYGSDDSEYTRFERASKESKMILIDDIHLIKSQHVGNFLEGIEDEFGYVIYTTNNLLKLDIQERIKAAIAKDSYTCYRILPLFRAKRKELVEKIIPLKYPTYSQKEKADQVERICHVLDLQRRYIPLTPEIILQFVEHYANYQMESVQNDGNIFGKVFESSITNILSPHMSGTLTVDKAMIVLGKIAFYIHSNRKYPISDKERTMLNVFCNGTPFRFCLNFTMAPLIVYIARTQMLNTFRLWTPLTFMGSAAVSMVFTILVRMLVR